VLVPDPGCLYSIDFCGPWADWDAVGCTDFARLAERTPICLSKFGQNPPKYRQIRFSPNILQKYWFLTRDVYIQSVYLALELIVVWKFALILPTESRERSFTSQNRARIRQGTAKPDFSLISCKVLVPDLGYACAIGFCGPWVDCCAVACTCSAHCVERTLVCLSKLGQNPSRYGKISYLAVLSQDKRPTQG
jgi:hypothetical protein